jgi:hypothetical protein
MASLLDIAPLTETVSVGGVEVEVYGVSAAGVASLLARFPELRKMMSGMEVSPERLMEMGGEAVSAIIAAGCGSPSDRAAEEIAAKLSVDVQADFIAKILKLTLPNGLGPFVEKLTALGATLGADAAAASARAPATKSRK